MEVVRFSFMRRCITDDLLMKLRFPACSDMFRKYRIAIVVDAVGEALLWCLRGSRISCSFCLVPRDSMLVAPVGEPQEPQQLGRQHGGRALFFHASLHH